MAGGGLGAGRRAPEAEPPRRGPASEGAAAEPRRWRPPSDRGGSAGPVPGARGMARPPPEQKDAGPPSPGPGCGGGGGSSSSSSSSSSVLYSSLGASQCFRCLITFPDEKFKERHMKREHPEDFVQANLRDALFICFVCSKAFGSSRALIRHQRGHAPALPSDFDCARRLGPLVGCQRHRLGHGLPHPCPECGKRFRQLSNLRRHQAFHQQTQELLLPSRPFCCMECGERFSQEGGLHQHYILHARGEL